MKKFVLASMLAVPALALAQASPVGPFTGDFSEDFESFSYGFFGAGVTMPVFDGNGDFGSGPTGNMNIASGWGFVCSLSSFGGTHFAGSAAGAAQYDFDEGISQFGGYLGTNSAEFPTDATAEFYDESGTIIDTATIAFDGCGLWGWHGWEFDAPVYRVILRNSAFGGAFVMMDSMEVSFGGGGCRADIDGDGSLTLFDFLEFQNLFDAGDLAADFDGDGSLTLFDFLEFQNEFDAGCE